MEYANQLFEFELQKIQNKNDKILLASIWENKHIFLSGELSKHLRIKQDIIYSKLAKIIGGSVDKHRRRWNYIRYCYKSAEEAKKSYRYNGILRVMYNNSNDASRKARKRRVANQEPPKSDNGKETPVNVNETPFNTALGQSVWEHFAFVKESFWSCNICLKEFKCLICSAWVLFKHLETQHVPCIAT